MFMSLLGFGIDMMLASFHLCGMMLLFSDILYMLVKYATPIVFTLKVVVCFFVV